MSRLTRRDFVGASLGVGAGLLAGPQAFGQTFRTKLKKALICALPQEKALTAMKAAGFDGVECQRWQATPADAEQGRAVAEKLGMQVHSVMRGWCSFNQTDPAKVKADIESVRHAIRTAKLLGADAVLLVPCRIGGPVPKPWDYEYAFDPQTCLVDRVVAGDNTPYKAYIEAHNRATATSREAVNQLIPYAAEHKVVIALENVWNNLWVKPDIFAAFVRSFRSPWVKAYLDLGNHVKYAPTIEWVEALGHDIAKCHVKDFKLNPDGHGGKWADIRDGSVAWPKVREALEGLDYNGWLTIEGSGGLSLQEKGKRLDLILAGK
jgi:hexulose-6-phosphate isomerase